MFDTWAWWEVLHATPVGVRLAKRYLEEPSVRLLTVDLAIAEISAKLWRAGRGGEVASALAAVEAASEVVPITAVAAAVAGRLLTDLRAAEHQASLADAVMLAVARQHGAKLVSRDPCFRDQADVVGS